MAGSLEDQWGLVDGYIADKLLKDGADLASVLDANAAAGLPLIDVSPAQGKLLCLLARISGARRVLEIGTLGGYSTIWLARALPAGGTVVTLELDARHAEVARANFAQAGVEDRIDLRVGPALDTLADLAQGGVEPFDLVFIDADKENNADYLGWAIKLSRPGTVIIGDNVVRSGKITDPASEDTRVEGTQRFFDRLAMEPRVSATAIQTVGSKGWDGFVMAIVD